MKKSRSRSRSKSRSRKAGRKVTIKVETKQRPVRGRRGRGGNRRSGLATVRRVAAPVARASTFKQFGPRVNRGKTFNVKHREMIFIVSSTGGVTWTPTRFQIQPGDSSTFPWLSTIAMSFKEYRIRNIEFHYEPNCSTSTAGSFIGVPLYDANQDTPSNFSTALDCKNAVTAPLWQKVKTDWKGQKFMKNLLVRTTTLSTPSIAPMYDAGAFVLSVNEVSGAASFGKIFVSYDIDFFIPIKPNGMTGGYGGLFGNEDGSTDSKDFYSASNVAVTVGGYPQVWFPDKNTTHPFFELGGSDYSTGLSSPNTIQLSTPGYYMFMFTCLHANTTNFIVSSIGTVGCTIVSYIDTPATVVSNTRRVFVILIKVLTPDATVTMNTSATSTIGTTRQVLTTMPNQMFNDDSDTEFGSAVPIVYSLTGMHDILRADPKTSKYFAMDHIHVLADVDYKEYARTGVLEHFKKKNKSLQCEIEDIWTRLRVLGVDLKKADIPSGLGGDSRPPHEPPSFDRKSSVTVLGGDSDDDFKIERADSPVPLKGPPLQVAPVAAAVVPVTALVVQGEKRKAPKQG